MCHKSIFASQMELKWIWSWVGFVCICWVLQECKGVPSSWKVCGIFLRRCKELCKNFFFFFFSRSTKNELCLVVWCKHKEVFDIIFGKKIWFWFFLFLEQTCKGFKEEIRFYFGVSTLFFWVGERGCCNFVVCCLIGKGSYEGEMFVCCVGGCWSNCFHVQYFCWIFLKRKGGCWS